MTRATGNPRNAEKTGPTVDKILKIAGIESALIDQMDDNTGVKGTAAGSHHQSVDRRKAHCACNAASSIYRAETRAVSKMRNDETATSNFRRHGFYPARNVRIGNTMEAVAADSGV